MIIRKKVQVYPYFFYGNIEFLFRISIPQSSISRFCPEEGAPVSTMRLDMIHDCSCLVNAPSTPLVDYITSAPNGIKDNFAILKNCFPKGIPIIVIQHIKPATAFSTAIGIPDTISQIIFAIKLTAPPPYTTSFPNGKNAKPANLKHCKPIGIPIMEMHHRQPAKTHDNPLNNPPHINQSIFPNMLF